MTIATQILLHGQVKVIVIDTGNGLEEDVVEQVFDAFYSTKQEGTGMGLPISRSIVEAHGGKLCVEPNTGSGTTFGFTIPRESGPSQ